MKTIFKDNIFRGYDIRAQIPNELNFKGAYILGKAYGTFLSQRRINQAVVVRDNRITGPKIRDAFVKGMLDTGINVIDHGLGTAPMMYFSQYYNQSKGGASISASHNPSNYNGFKLANGFSHTLVTEEIQELKVLAKKGKFYHPVKKGKLVKKPIFQAYLKDLQKRIPEKFNFKIVFDGGNCTPAKFMPAIFKAFGCKVISQNIKLDGNFPLGTPDPTETDYLNRLSKTVVKHQADMGFCYDPDGDRIGVVDQDGTKIWNDVLVALFAKDIIHYLPGSPIIYNTLCSKIVTDVIKKAKGKPIMWVTGHSFIKAKVKETNSPFGGELSGHFFFMDNFYGHDDGAFATLRLLSYLKRTNQTLKQAISKLPKYISSPEIKLGLPDKIKFNFISKVIGNDLKKLYPKADYIEIDGVRMDTKDTMAIVRASQNGPYITIKYEGKTQKQYDTLKNQLRKILKSHQEIDWSYGVNTDAFDK
ncbi:MAG: phosphomannomutase/phosphoglucomutase [Patescibacteria group bacterium]|nr:phosphomannomutase/phosphoglucomutase [Patescibacteria group bacterium]